ncbi:branched-chain-amino-acid transaminase [Candidatus Poribacteria bacterium]|nr:branched-chain-amino-acid transaminase [Candidatus Poribacteria bacterium]MYA70307.1 branched-chain-amino-acid transaminase [Candidatus Poribacteria bacterium]MYH83812.1 branched-chain-amino-acid transaminase [Candidatus Poribacteria bacterium]MYK93908.1 branched-chain-amino-acid transaminase [Candidatus Poribacteria bacterium]
MLIYIDGEFLPKAEAKVSVFDHGLLYGDGVFEGIRSYNGRVFKLDEHLERLYDSAKSIMLEIPISIETMKETVLETLRRNHLREAYIRLIITRGVGDLGLDPDKCPKPSIIIIADKIVLYPQKFYEDGLEIVTASVRRNYAEAINPRIKSLNYLNNILAKIEGKQAGAEEVLMLNAEGYVVECSGDNIFWIKNGTLVTPPVHMGILEGVTRNSVIDIAREAGIRLEERVFTRHDLYIADECFLTGTAAEVIPVVKIDRRAIGDGQPGKMTQRLIAAFRQYANTCGTPIYTTE